MANVGVIKLVTPEAGAKLGEFLGMGESGSGIFCRLGKSGEKIFTTIKFTSAKDAYIAKEVTTTTIEGPFDKEVNTLVKNYEKDQVLSVGIAKPKDDLFACVKRFFLTGNDTNGVTKNFRINQTQDLRRSNRYSYTLNDGSTETTGIMPLKNLKGIMRYLGLNRA